MTLKPARTPWRDFPPVVIHSPEIAVKRHPAYRAAKSGDVQAAFSLVKATIAEPAVDYNEAYFPLFIDAAA